MSLWDTNTKRQSECLVARFVLCAFLLWLLFVVGREITATTTHICVQQIARSKVHGTSHANIKHRLRTRLWLTTYTKYQLKQSRASIGLKIDAPTNVRRSGRRHPTNNPLCESDGDPLQYRAVAPSPSQHWACTQNVTIVVFIRFTIVALTGK